MSLKKSENKNLKFKQFKKFVKQKNPKIKIKKMSKKQKVFLVFALIHVCLQTNEKYGFITENYLRELFLQANKSFTRDSLIHFFYFDTIKKFYSKKNIDEIDSEKFYNNLISFYNNSFILNFFYKKRKTKKINIDKHGIDNYILLNKNLKFILNFIKELSPHGFNWIYRKIVLLS